MCSSDLVVGQAHPPDGGGDVGRLGEEAGHVAHGLGDGEVCPIVTINTVTYSVTIVYDPPAIPASTATLSSTDALLAKIEETIGRILDSKYDGSVLCFLPGKKIIKDCIHRLSKAPFSRRIFLIPLYGRLAKEEQERVFMNPPFGRKKVIVSTNIAETSLTIPGITAVIDSGLAKLNFYNPRTFAVDRKSVV